MNKIEILPTDVVVNENWYRPYIYVTTFGKWCITYKNVSNLREFLCSVVVEPENEPRKIEDTIGYSLNEYIGNAKTLDDAIDMINEYVKKYEA